VAIFASLKGIAMNQMQVFHVRKAEGHRRRAFVIRRDAQPLFYLSRTVDRAHQESVEGASEARGWTNASVFQKINGEMNVERQPEPF
jgi:hypothetical protein